jgi:hypothetical protein
MDVNPDTADASSARGWLERNEVVATRSEVDRACGIDYLVVRDSRPGVREDEKATEVKELLTSV